MALIQWKQLDTDLASSLYSGSFNVTGSIVLNGIDLSLDQNIFKQTGSFTGSFSGSLFGTASFATTASFAISSSNAISSSFAISASYAPSQIPTLQQVAEQGRTFQTSDSNGILVSSSGVAVDENSSAIRGEWTDASNGAAIIGNAYTSGVGGRFKGGLYGGYFASNNIGVFSVINPNANTYNYVDSVNNTSIIGYNGGNGIGVVGIGQSEDSLQGTGGSFQGGYKGLHTSGNSIGLSAYSNLVVATFDNDSLNEFNDPYQGNMILVRTSTIERFKIDGTGKVTVGSVILSPKLIINTTVDNGVDKVQVSGSTNLNGNTKVTGSLIVTNGITGSLFGTASFAVSSSRAVSSSFATQATSASNALTASFTNISELGGFVQGGNSFGTTALIGTNDNNALIFETSGSARMFISSSGNVGIGKINPTRLLDINGDVLINELTVGRGGGNINTNSANGNQALKSNTTGYQNTANGGSSLISNTIGTSNTANGFQSLALNTSGTDNTANGVNSLFANTIGINNVANGFAALKDNTSGNSNTANGTSALESNTIGSQNAANGAFALRLNIDGSNNTAHGTFALNANTTGDNNTATGRSALFSNTTGSNNVANGYNAGRYIANKTTQLTVISDSIMIGTNTSPLANSQTNQIVIGYNATGLGSNTTVIGNTNTTATAIYGDLLIGSTTDNGTDKLQVLGSTKLNGNTVITGSLRGFVSASTITSTTASIDFLKSNFFTVALVNGVNTHISASNIQPGQTTSIRVTQGSLGTGTVTFSTAFKQPTGSFYTASVVNNAVDILSLISFDSSTAYMVNIKNLI